MKRFPPLPAVRAAVVGALALATLGLAGCSSDPVQSTPSFEARGTVLVHGTSDLVVDSSGVTGSIDVTEGEVTDEIGATFIAKSDGKRTLPTGTDFKLGWTVADPTIATIDAAGSWSFKVHGVKAGTATVTFTIKHGTTLDYTSAPITIRVQSAVHGLATGDTATFAYYDRDTMNQRVTSSEARKKWIVAATNLTVGGKSGVSLILEHTTDLAGTEVAGPDSVYMQTDVDGSVYVYDYLRTLLGRATDPAAFGDKLAKVWVKLSNTTTTTAASWKALATDSLEVKNVTAQGVPLAINITCRMNASHKGTQSATVPAGTYPAAVHTDHSLGMIVKPTSIPITAMNDSLAIHCDASQRDGFLRIVLESKTLTANVLGTSATLTVYGYDMELLSIGRKK